MESYELWGLDVPLKIELPPFVIFEAIFDMDRTPLSHPCCAAVGAENLGPGAIPWVCCVDSSYTHSCVTGARLSLPQDSELSPPLTGSN